jgi:PAS domain-containing protein
MRSVPRAVGRVRNLQARHKTLREPVNIAFQLTEGTKNYTDMNGKSCWRLQCRPVRPLVFWPITTILMLMLIWFVVGVKAERPVYRASLTPVDNMQVVVTCDMSGTIQAASDGFLILFGYQESEVVGHNISMLAKHGQDIDFTNFPISRYGCAWRFDVPRYAIL